MYSDLFIMTIVESLLALLMPSVLLDRLDFTNCSFCVRLSHFR